MFRLRSALRAWGGPAFESELKRELEALDAAHLPLQQGLRAGSYALHDPLEAMILRVEDAGERIRVRTGMFYAGVVAGCNCADDPTPVEAQREYCELQLEIDKATAATTVTLLD